MSSTQYTKKIALIDCNSFYVSCERLFNPKIRNKPVVVLSSNDGCIISRSNEAKTLGIKMCDPYFKAKDIILKNNVHVFSSNYSLYGDLSRRVMRTLKRFNSEIEIYSIDEAFLDLTNFSDDEVEDVGKEIRSIVLQWTGIPTSIGIAKTKTLSKIANHIAQSDKFISLNAQVNAANIGTHNIRKYKDINCLIINETELQHEMRQREGEAQKMAAKLKGLINANYI